MWIKEYKILPVWTNKVWMDELLILFINYNLVGIEVLKDCKDFKFPLSKFSSREKLLNQFLEATTEHTQPCFVVI